MLAKVAVSVVITAERVGEYGERAAEAYRKSDTARDVAGVALQIAAQSKVAQECLKSLPAGKLVAPVITGLIPILVNGYNRLIDQIFKKETSTNDSTGQPKQEGGAAPADPKHSAPQTNPTQPGNQTNPANKDGRPKTTATPTGAQNHTGHSEEQHCVDARKLYDYFRNGSKTIIALRKELESKGLAFPRLGDDPSCGLEVRKAPPVGSSTWPETVPSDYDPGNTPKCATEPPKPSVVNAPIWPETNFPDDTPKCGTEPPKPPVVDVPTWSGTTTKGQEHGRPGLEATLRNLGYYNMGDRERRELNTESQRHYHLYGGIQTPMILPGPTFPTPDLFPV